MRCCRKLGGGARLKAEELETAMRSESRKGPIPRKGTRPKSIKLEQLDHLIHR